MHCIICKIGAFLSLSYDTFTIFFCENKIKNVVTFYLITLIMKTKIPVPLKKTKETLCLAQSQKKLLCN